MDLQRLSDHTDIVNLMNRYALGVDLRDWSLYRSCFEDQFVLDAPGWPAAMGADEWVDIVRGGILNYEATQHQMSNHSVEVDGHHAECITYVRAVHHQPKVTGDPRWVLVGYYQLGLFRAGPGVWKIAKFNLTTLWNEGNVSLMELGPQPPSR